MCSRKGVSAPVQPRGRPPGGRLACSRPDGGHRAPAVAGRGPPACGRLAPVASPSGDPWRPRPPEVDGDVRQTPFARPEAGDGHGAQSPRHLLRPLRMASHPSRPPDASLRRHGCPQGPSRLPPGRRHRRSHRVGISAVAWPQRAVAPKVRRARTRSPDGAAGPLAAGNDLWSGLPEVPAFAAFCLLIFFHRRARRWPYRSADAHGSSWRVGLRP